MSIPFYGQNKDGDNLQFAADGKLGDRILMVDADKTVDPADLKGTITIVAVTVAAGAARTLTLPSAVAAGAGNTQVTLFIPL